MAKFFVGQRVKIIWSKYYPQYIGKQTRITSGLYEATNTYTGKKYFCYTVDIDPGFGPTPEQLEPILPGGHKPSEYSYEQLMDSLKEKVA